MIQNKNIRLILGIIGVLLLGYILWNVRTIIYYFFAAGIIAFIARPMMRLLGKFHVKGWYMPSWLKAGLILILFVAIVSGLLGLIIPTFIEQAHIISEIDTNQMIERMEPQIKSVTSWLKKSNINQEELIAMLQTQISQIFSMGDIGTYISGVLNGITDSLIAIFSILFISYFLLKDGGIVDNVVYSLTPKKYLEKIKTIFSETKDLLSRYFIGVLLQITIVMMVITFGLSILGVKNALLIGVVAGIFNIIPYVGPIIGALVGLSLAASGQLQAHPEMEMTIFLLSAIIPFAVSQALDNFVLQPLIFSKSVKAHPLEIFLVILAAGSLAGIIGMIVAVPTYSFIRIVAKEFFYGYKVVQDLTKDL